MIIFAYKSWLHCSHHFFKIIFWRLEFTELKVMVTTSPLEVPIWPFCLPQESPGCGVFSFPVGCRMGLWMGAWWEESFGAFWPKPLSLLLLQRLIAGSNTDKLKIGPTSVGRGKVHFTQAWLPWVGTPALVAAGTQSSGGSLGAGFARAGAERGPRGCKACERCQARNPNHFQLFLCRSNLLSIPTFTCNGNRFAF